MKHLLVFILATSVWADICICQFADKDSELGSGKSQEVPFYYLGCQFWLVTQKKCRVRKVININRSLVDYLSHKKVKAGETIKLGYVGHWTDSEETVLYLQDHVRPIAQNYSNNIKVDNTACSPMEDPSVVADFISHINKADQQVIQVSGPQSKSIGMWDKLGLLYKHSDLEASISGQEQIVSFPSCKAHIGKRCVRSNFTHKGFCMSDQAEMKKIKCDFERIKINRFKKRLYTKRRFRWSYLEQKRSEDD